MNRLELLKELGWVICVFHYIKHFYWIFSLQDVFGTKQRYNPSLREESAPDCLDAYEIGGLIFLIVFIWSTVLGDFLGKGANAAVYALRVCSSAVSLKWIHFPLFDFLRPVYSNLVNTLSDLFPRTLVYLFCRNPLPITISVTSRCLKMNEPLTSLCRHCSEISAGAQTDVQLRPRYHRW